ncbi:MAG: hypothetical protein V2A79_14925 [Planctomycetota bacterium]
MSDTIEGEIVLTFSLKYAYTAAMAACGSVSSMNHDGHAIDDPGGPTITWEQARCEDAFERDCGVFLDLSPDQNATAIERLICRDVKENAPQGEDE